jgi:hypothetical protein
MIDSRPPEKCHYCDKTAEYNDLADFAVVGVCKQHVKNYYSG